jgi:putative oxidoreductase
MLDDFALLFARIFLAGLFIWDGTVILGNVEGTLGYMDAFGVPGILLWPVVIFQIAGGILLLLGWFNRVVAPLFAAFALSTAFFFHTQFASQGEAIHFAKDIAISGGFLALFVAGPGRFSVDERGQ